MTTVSPDATRMEQYDGTDGIAVRPFRVEVPEGEVDDLRRRLLATRWPEKETVADPTQGVQLATIQELARYWANDYDFRRFEARLNAVPQFVTEIDGLDIHFIHVRSPHPNALPVDHHARLARLGHRDAQRHRPAHRPDGATAATPRTPSTSWSPRCPATGTPASRRRPAGAPSTSRTPGSC